MIKRADGLYQAQATIRENGKKRQKYFYGQTIREVNRKMTAYQGEVAKGPLFATVAASWEDEHLPSLANGTKMCYSPAIKRAKAAFDGMRVSDVTASDVSRLLMELKGKGLSAKTIKTEKTVLNMIFNYAIVSGFIDVNPAVPVRLPANLPRKRRELPTDAMLRTVQASVDLDFGLFAYLLLFTGCRRGEALALQYRDIKRDERIIDVSKSIYFENNKPKLKATKTEAGCRQIILLEQLADHLPTGPMDHYLFGGAAPLTERAFRERWEKYCLATKLAEVIEEKHVNPKTKRTITTRHTQYLVTPHQLRHAYATILYEAGIDEFAAKTLLGHTDIKLTRDIYTHIRQSKQATTETKLQDYLTAHPL